MKYGCIARRLSHSYSREIHACIGDYDYAMTELPPDELGQFLLARDFLALNVTIPYKEAVIPYLSELDCDALSIGAVNTIINRGGKLYGYNTDFGALKSLIISTGKDIGGKKVLILGTGGTSKTAAAVAKALGAAECVKVSRTKKEDAVTYEEAYLAHADAEVIINATPVGMYPEIEARPIDISRFARAELFVDAIYNPLRTRLALEAEERGITVATGLYMLAAQAVGAAKLFPEVSLTADTEGQVFESVLKSKENIVLIGMPSAGKTTAGRIISERLKRKFYDTDELVTARVGMTPGEFIKLHGEAAFRREEGEAVRAISAECGAVIATGGGTVTDADTARRLKMNGRLYFLDRCTELLTPTDTRPLSNTKDALLKLYDIRHPIYLAAADVIIDGDGEISGVCDSIIASHFGCRREKI